MGSEQSEQPARKGQAWDGGEERQLYDAFVAGKAVADIAAAHARTSGGIRACLQKMGLIDEEGATVEPRPDFAPSASAQKRSEKIAKTAVSDARRQQEEEVAVSETNPQLTEALRLMGETDSSVFITGRAGTGKSTLLKKFRRGTKKNLVILAPTGIAALHVGGQTIHNFFRFSIDVTPQKVAAKRKIRNPKIYKKLQVIVIDEISMVRADILDCIEGFLRMHGPQPGLPFGGVQMVFMGDLYQLPPVVGRQDRGIFEDHYQTPYFFSAHALQDFDLPIIELGKVYRQKDRDFVALLNRVRDDTVTEADLAHLNTRREAGPAQGASQFSISLTATNRRADEINAGHLSALRGKSYSNAARVEGEFGQEYFPASPDLSFKIGAQVMLLNNDRDGRWVNGSIGVIGSVQKDEEGREFLTVDLQGGESVPVYPHKWEVFHFALRDNQIHSEPVGTFEQYPFRLAWAVTIHKSQGKTFDRVTIDIGSGAFASGQVYVALSRCTSFEGITLSTPLQRRHISTDPRIIDYMRKQFGVKTALEERPELLMIETAIQEQSMIEIVYIKSDGETTKRAVYPRDLSHKKNKGTEYLGMKAFCTLSQQELLFSVDRIIDIKLVA